MSTGVLSESILHLVSFSSTIQPEYSNTSYYFWLLLTTEAILRWVIYELSRWLPKSLPLLVEEASDLSPVNISVVHKCLGADVLLLCCRWAQQYLRKLCLRSNHYYSSSAFLFKISLHTLPQEIIVTVVPIFKSSLYFLRRFLKSLFGNLPTSFQTCVLS